MAKRFKIEAFYIGRASAGWEQPFTPRIIEGDVDDVQRELNDYATRQGFTRAVVTPIQGAK